MFSAGLPIRRENLGHFQPNETFTIETPSVIVTITSDMVPGMQPGYPRYTPGGLLDSAPQIGRAHV